MRVLALACAVLCLPAATALTADIELAPGLRTARLSIEGDVHGLDASAIRKAIDHVEAGGNGDGTVTHGEATHFVLHHRSTFRAQMDAAVRNGNLTFDGRAPAAVLENVTLRGAEGPATSLTPIHIRVEATLRLQPAPADPHVLRFSFAPGGGTLSLTVVAPEGLALEAEGGNRSADGRRVTFAAADGPGPHEVLLRSAPASQGSPAPGAGLAIAAGLALRLAKPRNSRPS